MHLKLLRAAAAVAVLGGTATLGLGSTQAALAGPTTTVLVPCSTSSLVTDMTSPANDTVLILAPGCTYWLTATLPRVMHTLTIVGHQSSIVRSYADDTASFSIFSVGSADGNLTLINVNVRNGGGDEGDGGAIHLDPGTVTIHGGTFSDNNTTEYGGAIYNLHGTLTVDGATFTGNSSGWGGAIYSENDESTATLNHDTFIGNHASDEGGAIYNEDNDMTIGGGNFRYNTSHYGGAIYNDFDLTISDTLFSMNSASDEGGAVYNADTVTIDGSLITVNRATDGGGGIYNDDTVALDGSLITVNRATDGGGGIYHDDDATVHLAGDLININAPDNCEPTGTIAGCIG
jgi:predicted outer membrane repeat protein